MAIVTGLDNLPSRFVHYNSLFTFVLVRSHVFFNVGPRGGQGVRDEAACQILARHPSSVVLNQAPTTSRVKLGVIGLHVSNMQFHAQHQTTTTNQTPLDNAPSREPDEAQAELF